MAKNLKLHGAATFGHPSFIKNGDKVRVKKGEVVRVSDDVAEHLLQREQRLSDEDSRPTWIETDVKAKHNFSTDEDTGADPSTEEGGESGTPKPTQRRARTAK